MNEKEGNYWAYEWAQSNHKTFKNPMPQNLKRENMF